jgi:hypothetical protein
MYAKAIEWNTLGCRNVFNILIGNPFDQVLVQYPVVFVPLAGRKSKDIASDFQTHVAKGLEAILPKVPVKTTKLVQFTNKKPKQKRKIPDNDDDNDDNIIDDECDEDVNLHGIDSFDDDIVPDDDIAVENEDDCTYGDYGEDKDDEEEEEEDNDMDDDEEDGNDDDNDKESNNDEDNEEDDEEEEEEEESINNGPSIFVKTKKVFVNDIKSVL